MKIHICMLFIIFTAVAAFSDIAFDSNGKWSTTFDCASQSQLDIGTYPTCDDMAIGGNWTFIRIDLTDGVSNFWTKSTGGTNEYYYTGGLLTGINANPVEAFTGAGVRLKDLLTANEPVGSLLVQQFNWGDNDSLGYDTIYIRQSIDTDPDLEVNGRVYALPAHSDPVAGDYVSSIDIAANYSGGGGGRGFRTIDGEGQNRDTGPIAVVFPTAQKELWIRWYQRHQSGYNWETLYNGPYPLQDKHVYLFTAVQDVSAIAGYLYREYAIQAQATANNWPVESTGNQGWPAVMGAADPDIGADSDGEYHCFEIYVKMDTDGADGIGRVWIDGLMIVENTAVDWAGEGVQTPTDVTTAREGWIYFKFGENNTFPKLGGVVMDVDHDDLVVYNTTPPNTDAGGNPYIGPIQSEVGTNKVLTGCSIQGVKIK